MPFFAYFWRNTPKKLVKNSLICDFLCIFAVNWLHFTILGGNNKSKS